MILILIVHKVKGTVHTNINIKNIHTNALIQIQKT